MRALIYFAFFFFQAWSIFAAEQPDEKQAKLAEENELRSLLWKHCPPKILTFRKEPIGVEFSQTGKFVLIKYSQGRARIWDLEKSSFTEIKPHQTWTIGPVLNHGGNQLLGCFSRHRFVFDISQNKQLFQIEMLGQEVIEMKAAFFSPEDKMVFLVDAYGQIEKRNSQTGELIQSITTDAVYGRKCVVSHDQRTIFSTTEDFRCILYRTEPLEIQAELKGHHDQVTFILFSPDDKSILTASDGIDKRIKLWDVSKGGLLAKAEFPANLKGARFSRDGTLLLTLDSNRMARLLDAKTLESIDELQISSVDSLIFCPEKKIFDVRRTGGNLPHTETATGLVYCENEMIAVAPNGQLALTLSGLFNAQSAKRLLNPECSRMPFSATFSPDGAYCARLFNACRAEIWDLRRTEIKTLGPNHLKYLRAVDQYVLKIGNNKPQFADFLQTLAESLGLNLENLPDIGSFEQEIWHGFLGQQKKKIAKVIGRTEM